MPRKKAPNHARRNPLRLNHNPANLTKTGLRNVQRHQPLIKFPRQQMTLVLQTAMQPTRKVHFRVPLEMTKPEIKEYLRTFYDLDVTKVNTMIYHGKKKRNKVTFKEEKEEDFKKAIVTLSSPVQLEGEFIQQMMQELAKSHGIEPGAENMPDAGTMEQMKALRDKMTPEQLEELERLQGSQSESGETLNYCNYY